MRRIDLVPLLLDQSWSLVQLAARLGQTITETVADIRHLQASLRHLPYRLDISPAWCRHCGFRFSQAKMRKPGKCPQCRRTWIAEPRLTLLRGNKKGGMAQ